MEVDEREGCGEDAYITYIYGSALQGPGHESWIEEGYLSASIDPIVLVYASWVCQNYDRTYRNARKHINVLSPHDLSCT